MAPPPFPMYPPRPPRDGPPGAGGPDAAPVFGAGPGDDPGYLASLRSPRARRTELGRTRLMMLALLAAPVLILAITPLIVAEDGRDAPPPWVYAPLAAAALLALLAGPRTPRPLDPGLEPGPAARAALAGFRQAVAVRFTLAEAVVLAGLPLAIVARSELVFVAGFAAGYPLLLWLALPTRGGVERLRRRLEERGAESHLWAVLLAAPPAPPPHDTVP